MPDNQHEGCGIETSFIEPDSQAQCPACDWKGPWRPSEQEAAQDLKDHFAGLLAVSAIPDNTCEKCGTESDELRELPDCDPSVGYHGVVVVCEECAEGYKNHCGACV